MNSNNNEIVILINNAITEVKLIKTMSEEESRAIDELGKMIFKLRDIKSALEPTKKTIKDRIDYLNTINDELKKIKSDALMSEIDQIIYAIEKNLLDGMSLKSIINKENTKLIIFEEREVGTIEVLDDMQSEIILRITVFNCCEDFPIQEPLKIYSIISFINNKFNYKLEQ